MTTFANAMSTDAQMVAFYDWIEALVRAGEFSPPPAVLAASRFTGSTWEERPNALTKFSGWVSSYTPGRSRA